MAIPGSILPVFSAVNISVRMIIAPPNSRSMSFGLPYRETMPLKSRRKYSTNPIAARHIAIYSAFNSFLSVFWNIIRKQTTIAKPRCILEDKRYFFYACRFSQFGCSSLCIAAAFVFCLSVHRYPLAGSLILYALAIPLAFFIPVKLGGISFGHNITTKFLRKIT